MLRGLSGIKKLLLEPGEDPCQMFFPAEQAAYPCVKVLHCNVKSSLAMKIGLSQCETLFCIVEGFSC